MHSSKDLAVSPPTFLSLVGAKLINDFSQKFGISFSLPFGLERLWSHLYDYSRRELPATLLLRLKSEGVLGLSSPLRRGNYLVYKDTHIIHDFSKIEKSYILC